LVEHKGHFPQKAKSAKRCKLVQGYSKLCKIVQNCAKEIIFAIRNSLIILVFVQNNTNKSLLLSAGLTREQLAEKMGVHRNTIRQMLTDVGITGRKRLSVAQQLRFYTEYPPTGEYSLDLK
jgi:hypothetical protein